MEVKNIDKSNTRARQSRAKGEEETLVSSPMRQIILDFPKQFRIGLEAAKNIRIENWKFLPAGRQGKIENLIICGMGGSGLPGDILVTLRPLDVFSYKSYRLPLQAGKKSLIICISYSGNTEETLSAFQTAVDRNLPVVSITTGGKLAKLSKKYNLPCAILPPPHISPRLALGEMFAALIKVLENHHLLNKALIKEILELGDSLESRKFEEQGKKLAKRIFRKIPIIYNSRRFREVGWIWKNSLNETAKVLAMTNYFPELNHNETVGYWKINEMQIGNNKLYVIILRDKKGSHPRILKQMEITKDLIEREGVKVEFIDIVGKTLLEKVFSTILLGFWTSYHLALLYKVDPTQIKMIDEFKKRLAK